MSEIRCNTAVRCSAFERNGRRRTFGEYAAILRTVLERWISVRGQLREEKLNEEAEELILPSNEDWRQRVYYRLVELQRECDAQFGTKRVGETESSLDYEEPKETDRDGKSKAAEKSWEWEPRIHGSSLLDIKRGSRRNGNESRMSRTSVVGSMTEARVEPGWRVNDILLAAEVLRRDSSPTYSDEAEMRRVFGLVYDVLRYKRIFGRALDEVGFWLRNSKLVDRRKIVWLLLYDMQGRKFASRGEIADVMEREILFQAAGLMDIEKALLEAKTHLAASISRLRIRGSALSLDELLPSRLRVIEGVAWGEEAETGAVASGWVNGNKFANKQEFHEEMSKLKLVFCEDEDGATDLVDETGYAFDSICPKIVNLHEEARETLALSALVRDHRFVFLDRSLCLGAAALVRAIRVGRFCGPVVLTHALAPRHTGYLAELLKDCEDAGRLLAFGAGERRLEYETYLKDLGVTSQQCCVFSEKYVAHPVTAESERATVVLAIPPCSYTGVRDIVDLAVARGGDMDLLEWLTDACVVDGDHEDRVIERTRTLLVDQMSTLKYALTRPNVQFVIYEAHTVLPSETTEMIQRVVDYANRMAVARHVRDHPSKKKLAKEEGELRESDETRADDRTSMISVPDSDLFEVGTINELYGEDVNCAVDPGCFLAVIRRKEMMQFDSLFMIKVAESRGLFGNPNDRRERKREPLPLDRASGPPLPTNPRKRTKRFEKIEMERIMAHTHSSLTRTMNENPVCPRHRAFEEKNQSRVRKTRVNGRCCCTKNAATLVNVSLDDTSSTE